MDPKRLKVLREYYALHNPENLHNIEEIAVRFAGREDVLRKKLAAKYGGDGPQFPISSVGDENTPRSTERNIKVTYNPQYKIPIVKKQVRDDISFNSISFKPLVALQTSRITCPKSSMPLDNVTKCRRLLPTNHPEYADIKPTTVSKRLVKNKEAARSKPSSSMNTNNRLEQLSCGFPSTGPLCVLRKWLVAGTKVCVVIRRVNSIRGTIVGTLRAADRHLNLVLYNVEETYIPLTPNSSTGIIILPAKVYGKRRTSLVVTRRLESLMIRGDNVVSVFPYKKQD